MKNISLSQFINTLPAAISGVAGDGDILRVESGRSGAFVVINEAEYTILLDALRAVFAVAGSVDVDGKTINVDKLLAKMGA